MLKDRKELEEDLIQVMQDFKLRTKKVIVNDIKNHLRKYKIIDAQKWINNPESEVPNLDVKELFLLSEQVYLKTGVTEINPEIYFTEPERKKSRQHIGTYHLDKEITFPYTLENFTQLSQSEYVGIIPADLVAKLSMSRKLHYNFDVQRESKKKKVDGVVIDEIKTVLQNVIEINTHLKKNTLKPTQLVFNAAIGSADYGEPELIYDEVERKLTITSGTIIDILDGYHRTKGTEMAFHETGHIDFNFPILFTNYSDDEARKYQGQLAKATPIAKERAKALIGERMADEVLKLTIPKTELQGKVSNDTKLYKSDLQLVTYKVLAETIEEHFNIKKMIEVYKVSDYLVKVFNYLLGTFEEEFLSNPNKYRKTSLINDNNIFIGYLILAKRLMDYKADPIMIIEIVSSINFEKSNPLWKEVGVLDEKGNLNHAKNLRKNIADYFESIIIPGYEEVTNNG